MKIYVELNMSNTVKIKKLILLVMVLVAVPSFAVKNLQSMSITLMPASPATNPPSFGKIGVAGTIGSSDDNALTKDVFYKYTPDPATLAHIQFIWAQMLGNIKTSEGIK